MDGQVFQVNQVNQVKAGGSAERLRGAVHLQST